MAILRMLAVYLLCVAGALAAGENPASPCFKGELKSDTHSGLVVVAAMLPEPKPLGAPVSFSYVYAGSNDKLTWFWSKSFSVARVRLLQGIESDYEGVFGKLIVLELKAGDYALVNWGYQDGMNKAWGPIGNVAKVPFRVTAGRATYLGSLEPQLMHGEDIFGRAAARAWPTAADRSRRDVSLLLRKCPQVDIMDVDIAPLDLRPWLP